MNKIEETIRQALSYGAKTVDQLTHECATKGVCSSRATVKKYLDQMPDIRATAGRPVRYHRVRKGKPAPVVSAVNEAKTVYEPGQSDCLDHALETIRALADENMVLKTQLKAVREALV